MNFNKRRLQTAYIILLTAIFFPIALHAQSSDIKQRMKARLPQVISLKVSGSIGEDKQGYLKIRSSLDGSNTNLVQSENADREKIYTSIAKKVGDSAKSVGMKRAAQIRKSAKPGTWIQLGSGKWVQK